MDNTRWEKVQSDAYVPEWKLAFRVSYMYNLSKFEVEKFFLNFLTWVTFCLIKHQFFVFHLEVAWCGQIRRVQARWSSFPTV